MPVAEGTGDIKSFNQLDCASRCVGEFICLYPTIDWSSTGSELRLQGRCRVAFLRNFAGDCVGRFDRGARFIRRLPLRSRWLP